MQQNKHRVRETCVGESWHLEEGEHILSIYNGLWKAEIKQVNQNRITK